MGEQILGLITNIQVYSINDGPGIRTTVFMKGCPFKCKWCHNPEMINPNIEVWYRSMLCGSCGKCIEVCPVSAIKGYKDEREIDRDTCTVCLKCVEVCPTHSLSVVGKLMTVEEVLKEIRKDELFYRRNGGGATISGGEPTMQADFVSELLKQCKDHLIHAAIETCGYTSWDTMGKVAKHADLILYDIKHIYGTDVSNELILENAKKLAKIANIRIRIPVIPKFNDSEDVLRKIAEFMVSNNLQEVDLLPYHKYGEVKYKMLGKKYGLDELQVPSEELMQNFKTMFESYGLKVTIGG